MNPFLENVRTELDFHGMSQKELALKTGISVNTIRGWFSKDLVPDVFSAFKVSKAFNVELEYLITGELKSNSNKEKIITLLHEIEGLV